MASGRSRTTWRAVFLFSASFLAFLPPPTLAGPVGGQTVSGRLLDSESRLPIGSGTVALFDVVGAPVARTLTDVEGHFALQAPGPGRYLLRARASGYRGGLEPRFDLDQGQEVTTDLFLVPDSPRARTRAITAPGTSLSETDVVSSSEKQGAVSADTTITGVVRDGSDGRFLPGVFVRVQELRIGAVSDSSGVFLLRDVPEGEHVLLFDALGYTPLALPVQAPLPDSLLEVALAVRPIELAPLEVRVDRVIRQLDARLRAYQAVPRVADANFLRELDEVLDPKFALIKMGLGEGECTSGDCMRMFGKSKPVRTVVNDFPVSFDEFRAIPIRDLCRVEALYDRGSGFHTVFAFTCAFLRKNAEGLAPIVPDWWPWGRT